MSHAGGAHSIRRQLGVLLATLGVLVGALIVITTVQLQAADAQTRAENRRNQSFRLADSMRQSSNDLTRMVRLYVSTGVAEYRSYYDEILAIRAGTAPRPRNHDSSFWDRVLAEGKSFVEYDRPLSLIDQMRSAEFTDVEFDALNAALDASNGLAVVELDVMDRVAPRIAQGVDSTYFADVTPHYLRLVDSAYLTKKGVIMRAIEDFISLVDARTLQTLDDARSTTRALTVAQSSILGVIVVVGLFALRRASRLLLRPLDELSAATERFATGDYEGRVRASGVSELVGLAGAFNHMAAAVESDVGRRERAERDALDARRAAEEANRAKSSFVASMSHEIRTPMIGVIGMLEVLAQTTLDHEQQNMVSTASGSAQVLVQLIGDILDFSKIEAGKLELAPAPFSVRPLVTTVVQTFFHTASAKGLLLGCTVEDGVAVAHHGDALRIRQILNNFISNAVKFTPSGSVHLTVRVLADDESAQTVEFALSDTGIGVTPEQQRQLFQEFMQAESTTAAKAGGTGLGLVICRRLAELMSGDVRMDSVPGQGTTMYLTVPLPVADPGEVEAGHGLGLDGAPFVLKRPKPSREAAEGEGSLLLLAEDHPINQRVLVHQLGIIGFHVDTAENGRRALELFVRGSYGLVLSDLNMPEMDGFELARAIREHEVTADLPRVPIIALSANVLSGEAEKCAEAGMDDFAAKPSSMNGLAEKLRRWLPDLDWPVEAAADEAPPPADKVETEPSREVIDHAVLHELTGGDDALAKSILIDYVDSLRADIAAVHLAVINASADELRRHAHRISGASRLVGTTVVAEVAMRLEAAAQAATPGWSGFRAEVVDLESAIADVAALVAPVRFDHEDDLEPS